MKPTKVAFLVNEFPTLTETFIINQIVFLLQQGIDVHIFSLYRGDFEKLHTQYKDCNLKERVTYISEIPQNPMGRIQELIQFLNKDGIGNNFGIAIKAINPFSFGFSAFKLTHFLYFLRLKGINEYDLVHVHFGSMGVFFEMFSGRGFFRKLPYLISFHGYDLVPNQTEKNKLLYSKMLQSSKFFTVNSKYTRGILEKVEPKIRPRIRLLSESLDTSLFAKTDNQIKKPKQIQSMVHIGRLVDWKGADRAIEIVEKIVKEYRIDNVELIVIGEGHLKPLLERMVLEKGLQNHIRLIGEQDQSIVRSILAKADLFLYTGRVDKTTGRAENQGLVVMEAQAMGVPVVAFAVGGISEGIIDKETGILVPTGDVEAFADSVVTLLRDKEKRIDMGKSARKFVMEKFDYNVLGQQLLEIYEEVLN